jgi:predicted RNA-binding protein with PIN domain
VTFLIDGYNLMHAVGLARPGLPAGQLQRARKRFLDWLADAALGRDATLRVVFDAVGASAASPESDHRGVWVRFARGHTADDEIEALLAAEPHPARVTVVSNDSRVREAGRRRGAEFRSCEEFVDWTIEVPRKRTDPPRSLEKNKPDKPEPAATADEMAAWLAAFTLPPPKRRRG